MFLMVWLTFRSLYADPSLIGISSEPGTECLGLSNGKPYGLRDPISADSRACPAGVYKPVPANCFSGRQDRSNGDSAA